MSQFTLDVLQAINDWQRGGDHKQKVRRGEKLKEASQNLDAKFRNCSRTCYRQEAHEKDRVWQLLADDALPETIAAWTTDLATAKSFKGGVPPVGLQGIVFKFNPPASKVVLNLEEVYKDPDFTQAVAELKADIVAFGDGIGRYGDEQCEVVLEMGSLDQAHIYCYGGFASGRPVLAQDYFGRVPTEDDLKEFDALCLKAGISPVGDWWLTPEGTSNVISRIQPRLDQLRMIKAAQQTT
ncbi:hypothetical protein [Gemmobacter sp. 24YEA27]|uniref:hypothetical protein n=1 Tax=Gemmobacter sp. 24YEA27 TaxID=3040672 RepID=UPI0024B39E71|nr:hypothetical protein [Gemmobacter sp. 24YEA27]